MKGLLASFTLLLFAFIYTTYAAPQGDLITNLPGAPVGWNSTFKMYSGYINIDKTNNVNMFYWFVESARNPAKDPLMLWMNGGPGASSLLGFFSEHGPFRPNPDGKTLSAYPYAWNKIANMLYLEAPVGVGFSYSTNDDQYITNDNKTATQNYDFLVGWFDTFPEYKSHDFWITGESYGGKYCPELASVVLDNIQNGSNTWLNMKGLIVGNPGTESDWFGAPNEYSYLTTLYSHFIIPQASYIHAVSECGWSDFLTDCTGDFTEPSIACNAAVRKALSYLPNVLDPYDLYAPACLGSSSSSSSSSSASLEEIKEWNEVLRKWHPRTLGITPENVQFYPCLTNYLSNYLNQPDVQSAIHARATKWSVIGRIVYLHEYRYSVVPLWQRFIKETNWNILIYSGDVDSAVPTDGTQRWINCLNRPIKKDWRPWFFNKQTAGFRQDFDGISFQTIKGAGHMVPYYLPEQGFAFFNDYLSEFYPN